MRLQQDARGRLLDVEGALVILYIHYMENLL